MAPTIDRLDCWVLRAPIAVPVANAFGAMSNRPAVFLRVSASDGATGWGEVFSNFPQVGAEHRARLVSSIFAPMLTGVAADDPASVRSLLDQRTRQMAIQCGEPGPFAQITGAVDQALWDMAARRAKLPLWQLLGGSSSRVRGEQGAYAPRHLKVEFDEFDHGFVYRRILQNSTPADPLWTVGRVCLWPNALFTGDHFEWRVPIDDENTLSVTWHFTRVPREAEPYVQDRIPTWHGPLRDPRTGEWITTHVMNQDFVAWVGQGRIADRAQENLGQSDRGIAMIRRRFLADIEAVERGEDPKGVLRDPAANDCVTLPIVAREMLVDGLPKAAILADPLLSRFYTRYLFQAGQPAEVRDAFAAAVGIEMVAEEPLGI